MVGGGDPSNRLPFYSMPPVSFPLAMSCRGGVSLRIDIALGSASAQRKCRRKRRRQAPGIGVKYPASVRAAGALEGLIGSRAKPRTPKLMSAADMLARKSYGGLN